MKFVIEIKKPRNPLAVAARLRQAGAHRTAPKAQRQADRLALKRELSSALDHRHSP